MCYDGESPSVFVETFVKKSRKDHKCYECCCWIYEGDPYYKAAGVWNGEFEEYKVCDDCCEIREHIREIELSHGCRHDEAFVPFGMLREAMQDYPELKEPSKS